MFMSPLTAATSRVLEYAAVLEARSRDVGFERDSKNSVSLLA